MRQHATPLVIFINAFRHYDIIPTRLKLPITTVYGGVYDACVLFGGPGIYEFLTRNPFFTIVFAARQQDRFYVLLDIPKAQKAGVHYRRLQKKRTNEEKIKEKRRSVQKIRIKH